MNVSDAADCLLLSDFARLEVIQHGAQQGARVGMVVVSHRAFAIRHTSFRWFTSLRPVRRRLACASIFLPGITTPRPTP